MFLRDLQWVKHKKMPAIWDEAHVDGGKLAGGITVYRWNRGEHEYGGRYQIVKGNDLWGGPGATDPFKDGAPFLTEVEAQCILHELTKEKADVVSQG